MKQFLVVLAFSAALGANGQTGEPQEEITEVTKVQCSKFYITPPLRELTDESYVDNPPMKIGKDRQKREYQVNPNAPAEGSDAVRQSAAGGAGIPEIIVNSQGINGGFPPDPSGAIGPNHYVQAVNSTWNVFETDGSPDGFPVSLSSLWEGSTNDGDPIVMYDQFVDRWFISQFQQSGNQILIAISVTPDPTEEYYAYEFNLNAFPDYPKFSIWSDGYYMTANSFGQDLAVFERDKMINGDASASMIAINAPNVPTGNFYSMLPADADGDLPPLGTDNYLFFPGDDQWFGNNEDHIRIYKVSINWDNPNSSSVVLDQQLAVEDFNANFTNSWNDIPQPDSNQRLDAIAGIFTYRAQFRKWVGYNTMVLTMVVDTDGFNSAGIRWYELRQDQNGGEVGDWYVYQQSTFAPDDGNNRWLASAAMDDFGNIGMAYSVGGDDLSASIWCTGRLKWDPLNEMTFQEAVIVEGSGAQSGGNRFGDYSQTTLAPDGETFWFTGEYISGGNRRTRIASFRLNDPTNITEFDESKIEAQLYQNGENLYVNLSELPTNETIVVDIFDVRGALIKSIQTQPVSKGVSELINISDLSTGTYMIRFGNETYQVVERAFIQK